MCGIAGIYSFKGDAGQYGQALKEAVKSLSKRGPDSSGIYHNGPVGLAHTRLSIIDTSNAGSQPMTEGTGRYTIIFNGEIYNFHQLKEELVANGVQFSSHSDTEVLLHLYIKEGPACLSKLNGFFAFAVYDKQEKDLFIARDRIGIKPLLIYRDEEKLVFSSEMKGILSFPVTKELDQTSLYTYLQLNYIPAPHTIFSGVRKLEAGHYLKVSPLGKTEDHAYYSIPSPADNGNASSLGYEEAKEQLIDLLDKSVNRRLIADVPLGAFLSGGIDSSVIVALASRHTKLNTFSIGYKDEPYFDETHYAELVAKKFDTNHTVFSLSNQDLYDHLFDILEYIDEPFADSSAIAVYILSQQTRKKATVALSGDGADELFGGYNKHWAEYKARQNNAVNTLLKWSRPVWGALPQSRQSKVGNMFRQLARFSEGVNLSPQERYWRWCAFTDEKDARKILQAAIKGEEYYSRKKLHTKAVRNKGGSLNDNLYADMHLVLQNDMLVKVDMMSMANSLEVRVPFLDHTVVDFVSRLPVNYKVDSGFRKRILKDAFREVLPEELYHRPKHGFEVPLLKWFRSELKGLIVDDLLGKELIERQGIFDYSAIEVLKRQLFSANPGEIHARIWGLLVFQYWWKKYLG